MTTPPTQSNPHSVHPVRLLSWRFRATAGPALHLTPLQARHVKAVAGHLSDGGYALEPTACTCGERQGPALAAIDRYGLRLQTIQCSNCGTLRFDPYLTADAVADFYTNSYQDMYGRAIDHTKYFEKQKLYGRRLLAFLESVNASRKVVAEVGCGAGGALSVFQSSGSEVFGCDYSQRLVEYGRTRQLHELQHGDISALQKTMAAHRKLADVVLLHHVFEHLNSPGEWLKQARELLGPGGVIIVAVPDVANIDRYPSPAGDMRQFLHIAHKFNFTLKGLHALASRVGMVAAPLAIELSKQAPEIWVAFSAAPIPSSWVGPEQAWQFSPEELFSRLQAFERRYVWRAMLRRLGIGR